MDGNYTSQKLIKASPQDYVFPAFVPWGQACIPKYFLPMYFPPMCAQARPVQWGQPTLFIEEKTRDLPEQRNPVF